MRKIFIILMVFISVTACEKLDPLNANLKDFVAVPGQAVFNGANRALLNQMFTFNVNNNNTLLFVQQFVETTYADEGRYDMITRPIPATHMNVMYRTVLMQYKDAAKTILNSPLGGIDQKQRDNQLAIVEVMSVYAWSNLVETFGDMPYSEALDFNKANPKYDDGLTIYKDLIVRLNAAIAKMDPGFAGMGAGFDNVFGGEVEGTAKWIRFANTLKLRMGIMLSDMSSETALAKTTIEEAAPKVFNDPITSPTTGDKFAMEYLPSAPNQNPVYVDLVVSGRFDYATTSVYIDSLKAVNDPRLAYYMLTQVGGTYKGGTQGMPSSYSAYSHIDNSLLKPDREVVLMDYTEAEFLLAEATERGFSVGGTAAAHYNNAVTSSIKYWGGTDAEVSAYLAQPSVAYATAKGPWRDKIGVQSWYAYYLRGFTAWTNWRRLDYPRLYAPELHVQDVNGVPVRYIFAVSEQTLNADNYKAAAAAIGGDRADNRLFWDKEGPANYDSSFK